jgi:predicted PurR-regulated permease PerM
MKVDTPDVWARSMSAAVYDAAIRIGVFALFAYWSLTVVGPFLTVGLWSAILAIALYPLFNWLTWCFGSRRLAAVLTTLMCLLIVIGPVMWLGFGLASTAELWFEAIDSNAFSLPLPPETVKNLPLIGERAHQLWTEIATDTKATLLEIAPKLKPFGVKLLDVSRAQLFGFVEFVAAIVIAGFLYAPGPRLVSTLGVLMRRVFGARSEEMLKLVGNTIRNVSRGVVGISVVQSFLAGMGFLAADLPAAGFLTFLTLILGIIQLGPVILILPIIIWSWTEMQTTHALLFTIYMVVVSLIDNLLRPFVMARGLTTPMPVILIGVMGGVLAYGVSGLFLGPVLLAIGWALLAAGMEQDAIIEEAAVPRVRVADTSNPSSAPQSCG